MRRGEIWWADLAPPRGSGPGYRRPVVIIQSDIISQTAIQTVVIAVITSNLRLTQPQGNVLLEARRTGLDRDSVVNVSQLFTVDREELSDQIGALPMEELAELNAGLRLMLAL